MPRLGCSTLPRRPDMLAALEDTVTDFLIISQEQRSYRIRVVTNAKDFNGLTVPKNNYSDPEVTN